MRLPHLLLPLLLLVATYGATACGATAVPPNPLPTATLYPTSTPYPTAEPAGAAFLEALQARVLVDDSIPLRGRKAIIALIGGEPTFAFIDDPGLVLQYRAPLPPTHDEIDKIAFLLIGTGVVVAGEYQIPLTGIEVMFYTANNEPWLALGLAPPWDTDTDLRLAPLHPDYIHQLVQAGLITPTPAPTY